MGQLASDLPGPIRERNRSGWPLSGLALRALGCRALPALTTVALAQEHPRGVAPCRSGVRGLPRGPTLRRGLMRSVVTLTVLWSVPGAPVGTGSALGGIWQGRVVLQYAGRMAASSANAIARLRTAGEYSTKYRSCPDLGGLECTLQDGDLRRWNPVDRLPADCLQAHRGPGALGYVLAASRRRGAFRRALARALNADRKP